MYLFTIFLGTITVLGVITTFVGVGINSGYFERFEQYRRLKFIANNVTTIIQGLVTMYSPEIKSERSFHDNGKSLHVVYSYNGQNQLLFHPYDGKLRNKMRTWKVYLNYSDGQCKNITQEPGMPYTCSAEELGGLNISARSTLSNDVVLFNSDVRPMYLGLEK
jgi:hypothetical protein